MSNDFKSMNELLGDQVNHGQRLGFKTGGHVKPPASADMHMRTEKQQSNDHGLMPASEGTSEEEKEAGGTPKLRPGYKKGGKAKKMTKKAYRKKHGSLKGYDEYMRQARRTLGGQMTDKEAETLRKRAPKKKKCGGSMKKNYAEGGEVGAKEGGGKKDWIKGAIKKPGALRKSLGVKAGKDIPKKKLEAAAKKKGKMGKRARLAETLEGFHK